MSIRAGLNTVSRITRKPSIFLSVVVFFLTTWVLAAFKVDANQIREPDSSRLTILAQKEDANSQIQVEQKSPANEKVRSWFCRYDKIRKEAQMTPRERRESYKLIGRGIGILIPGFGRISAQRLLEKMIVRYERAIKKFESLQEVPETKELHRKYKLYFVKAHSVFVDCKRLIKNPLLSRAKNKRSLRRSIANRKAELRAFEPQLKQLDKELREKYKIAAYDPGKDN